MPHKALRQGANWVALELCTCQTLHAQLLSLKAAIHRTVADEFNVSGIPADFSARPPSMRHSVRPHRHPNQTMRADAT